MLAKWLYQSGGLSAEICNGCSKITNQRPFTHLNWKPQYPQHICTGFLAAKRKDVYWSCSDVNWLHEAEFFLISWLTQLIRKFSALYETWSFITKLTRLPLNCLLSRLHSVHTLLLHFFTVYLKIIYHLYLRLQNSLSFSGFLTTILDSTLVHVCYMSHPSFDFIILLIYFEKSTNYDILYYELLSILLLNPPS